MGHSGPLFEYLALRLGVARIKLRGKMKPSPSEGSADVAKADAVHAASNGVTQNGVAPGSSHSPSANGAAPDGAAPDGAADAPGGATSASSLPYENISPSEPSEYEKVENTEWLESLDYVLSHGGHERVQELLRLLEVHAHRLGVRIPFAATTPYINTIHHSQQPDYPGDLEMERRIRSLVRYNAMAMVVRANKKDDPGGGGVGGHLATFASAATLYEVAFNHFFRARNGEDSGDQIYFQGHASPGMYARAFLEGHLDEENLNNFRRELQPTMGLSSYPHPWLMPDFWQFPTVSMGLGPILSIYQARFNRYLQNRGLKNTDTSRVYSFVGDGECDEPETLGAITLAGREKLDNLCWVINCNLQRLDGPVRGNGKIIQELEGLFRGAGWNVIKVVWGTDWDEMLDRDESGELVRRMGEVIDGQYQKYSNDKDGAYTREHFFNSPYLRELSKHLSDNDIRTLRRGGHDSLKVYAAFLAAQNHKGQPTVILAKTVKGYGLGEQAEGKNPTHNSKKIAEEALRTFRTRFNIPVSEEEIVNTPFYRPADDAPEMKYLHERRAALGGYVPRRSAASPPQALPDHKIFAEFYAPQGTPEKMQSTTMVFVNLLRGLMRDKAIGKLIVPIIPDEARTFGMDSMFRLFGIYSSVGQLYDPADKTSVAAPYYKESQDGQMLEEGINEAGAMSSFVAAGSAYSTHGVNTIPFYIYYSMFGPQRVGDLMWLAADTRVKGFLLGATAGRTTLNGEGLQHEDGHSHLLLYPIVNLKQYDPAFSYELSVIIEDGIKRMYGDGENIFYYITLMNENYLHPAMPEGEGVREGVREGILRGMYKLQSTGKPESKLRAQLMGSGTILNEVVKAAAILEEKYGVGADVWSVTSYKELYLDALETERTNLLNPGAEKKQAYVQQCLSDSPGVLVASSDYVKALPESISKWMPRRLQSLGTDGFGRSETRPALRDFFEVDHRYVILATLTALADEKKIKWDVVKQAQQEMGISPDKKNPLQA
jgi:pyruvate dehydrogenase E1 component